MSPLTPRRSPLALALATAALVALGLTCRAAEPPPDRHPQPLPLGFPNGPHTPVPMPLPTTPVMPPPVPPHPALEELPPRTGAAGSTKGTIACGAGRCFAPSEVCTWIVLAAAWGCIPAAERTGGEIVNYACDDASDCLGEKRCCRALDRGVDYVRCAEPEEGCGARVCADGDGAACPAGQTCQKNECAPSSPPPATCDGKKACPKDKPICFWQDTEGECVSEERAREIATAREGEGGISLRRCTRPADCAAGFMCCGRDDGGLWSSVCAVQCDSLPKMDYCDTDADCDPGSDLGLQCRKARASGQAEMPPWSKRCGADPVQMEGPPPHSVPVRPATAPGSKPVAPAKPVTPAKPAPPATKPATPATKPATPAK